MKHVMTGALFAVVMAAQLSAHHSFAAEFDATKPVTLTGTVTRIEWANPHIWIYFDVAGPTGTQPWQCEGGAPNTLTRNGWSKDSLRAAQQIVVDGWLAKDGTRTCNMRAVKMPDGRTVFAGSSNGDAATPPKK
jgi:uncharacterized protein DUF6152